VRFESVISLANVAFKGNYCTNGSGSAPIRSTYAAKNPRTSPRYESTDDHRLCQCDPEIPRHLCSSRDIL